MTRTNRIIASVVAMACSCCGAVTSLAIAPADPPQAIAEWIDAVREWERLDDRLFMLETERAILNQLGIGAAYAKSEAKMRYGRLLDFQHDLAREEAAIETTRAVIREYRNLIYEQDSEKRRAAIPDIVARQQAAEKRNKDLNAQADEVRKEAPARFGRMWSQNLETFETNIDALIEIKQRTLALELDARRALAESWILGQIKMDLGRDFSLGQAMDYFPFFRNATDRDEQAFELRKSIHEYYHNQTGVDGMSDELTARRQDRMNEIDRELPGIESRLRELKSAYRIDYNPSDELFDAFESVAIKAREADFQGGRFLVKRPKGSSTSHTRWSLDTAELRPAIDVTVASRIGIPANAHRRTIELLPADAVPLKEMGGVKLDGVMMRYAAGSDKSQASTLALYTDLLYITVKVDNWDKIEEQFDTVERTPEWMLEAAGSVIDFKALSELGRGASTD